MLLQDIETCRQARLVLRELIKGDKSREPDEPEIGRAHV